jgi:hypothetical protein
VLAPADDTPSPALAEAEEPEELTMLRAYDMSVLRELEVVTGKEVRWWVWEKLAGHQGCVPQRGRRHA